MKRKRIAADKTMQFSILAEDGLEYIRPKSKVYNSREEAAPEAHSFYNPRYTFILKENFLNEWKEMQEEYLSQAHTYSDLVKNRARLGRRYLHTQLEVLILEAPKDTHSAVVIERLPFLTYTEQYRYKYFQ